MYTHSSAWQDYNTPLLSQTSTMNTRLARVVSLRFHKNIIVVSFPSASCGCNNTSHYFLDEESSPSCPGDARRGSFCCTDAVCKPQGIPRKFLGDCLDRYNIYYIHSLNKGSLERGGAAEGCAISFVVAAEGRYLC